MTNALVLRTAGTNCDAETIHALRISGAMPELLHVRQILSDPRKLRSYSILVIPGGFSYGDDIAAGRIFANELKLKLGEELKSFVSEKKLVVGICNGFQVLVKAGLLPGPALYTQTTTLTQNDSGRFQCEWIHLKKEKSRATWLNDLPQEFELPIAHGEGKFMAKDSKVLKLIEEGRQVVFRYAHGNPNGSKHSIAGICNPEGNVIGLMPHPERFVSHFQHPAWTRTLSAKKELTAGFLFWKSAVRYAAKV